MRIESYRLQRQNDSEPGDNPVSSRIGYIKPMNTNPTNREERDKILRDLTGLAASLVGGGVSKNQPDILLLGKILTISIGALDSEAGKEKLEEFLVQIHNAREEEEEVRKMLKDLGIG